MGRLNKAKVRDKWPNEAKDFTPCLSKNLNLLSEVLGFDLELVGTEVEAGPYRADIEARIPQSGERVVIENQLTPADPRHLGQLLHYHARLKAKISVWVAPFFWGTNLSAIGWLNRVSGDSFSFYAVRVSVYRDLALALVPVFEVLKYPNGWQDRRAGEFWAHLTNLYPDAVEPVLESSQRRVRHYVGDAGLTVVQYFRPDCVRVYLTGKRGETDSMVFSKVSKYRNSLEAELKNSEFLGGKNSRCTTQLRIDTHNRRNWDETATWLHTQREIYERVLREGSSLLN